MELYTNEFTKLIVEADAVRTVPPKKGGGVAGRCDAMLRCGAVTPAMLQCRGQQLAYLLVDNLKLIALGVLTFCNLSPITMLWPVTGRGHSTRRKVPWKRLKHSDGSQQSKPKSKHSQQNVTRCGNMRLRTAGRLGPTRFG